MILDEVRATKDLSSYTKMYLTPSDSLPTKAQENRYQTSSASMDYAFKVQKKQQPTYKIEFDREDDGRWIADIPALPGVLVYGQSKEEAFYKVTALAFRVFSEMAESGEKLPHELVDLFKST